MQQKYQDQGLEIVAVNLDQKPEEAELFKRDSCSVHRRV